MAKGKQTGKRKTTSRSKANRKATGGKRVPKKQAPKKAKKARKAPVRKAKPSGLKRLLKKLTAFFALLFLWAVILGFILSFYFAQGMPTLDDIKRPALTPSLVFYDKNGLEMGQRGPRRGEYLTYDALSPVLIEAILAAEDQRFYEHFGLDVWGILRAAAVNMQAGGVRQGGSTITQQLAKILFLEQSRTFKRKVQEALLALQLEWRFSKQEILTLYLNRIYLGAGNYGVDAAARDYFGVSARELDYVESAIIAGLIKAPSRLAPASNPEGSLARARVVLGMMINAGYLPDTPPDSVLEEVVRKIKTRRREVATPYLHYFSDWVMGQLDQYIAPDIRQQQLHIHTTLDAGLQRLCHEALNEVVKKNKTSRHVSQGAMLGMEPGGAIRVMVGGVDYQTSQYNRATQAMRQPGSAFKPLVYLAALEQGYDPDRLYIDGPVTVNGWSPSNYNNDYMGEMPLREALALSVNTVAVKLQEDVGRGRILSLANELGIDTPLKDHPSLALGTNETTLYSLLQAYAHFAGNGQWVRGYGIEKITDPTGTVLFERKPITREPIIQPIAAHRLNIMLQDTLTYGTGKRAALPFPAAAKTGTSQDHRDAWFIGYTPHLVLGVWLGNDDNTPMHDVTGGSLPATLWQRVMQAGHRDIAPQPFRLENTLDRADTYDQFWDQF